MDITQIPKDDSLKSIKVREGIIREFYREWKVNNPSQKTYNVYLQDYIYIRMVSVVETSEHAAKNYLSTIAVMQMDSILAGSKKISIQKTKPNNKNQKSFEKIMIMEYVLPFIGRVKMTVGIRRRTREKVLYCITVISNK